jgi:hypothetical protein
LVSDRFDLQLPLGGFGAGGRRDKADHRRMLEALDQFGTPEVDAVAHLDLPRQGGRYGRPVSYLCSDNQVYWTKTRSQTGLAGEFIANRLAYRLSVGPVSTIVRIAAFVAVSGGTSRAVGTLAMSDVVSSKELAATGDLATFDPRITDPESRARTAVFQSWVDMTDQQVLISTTDGRVYSIDHGDSFRNLLLGPPRMVVAPIPGVRIDWSATREAAVEMAREIEGLLPVEILQAAAATPDEPGWQGMFARRLGIARWLIKRQLPLREEVERWTRIAA